MTSVDRIQGLNGSQAFKIPCRVATTAPITASGLQTIDGVVLVAGDRVLRWSETDETLNGIFEVSTSAWPRTLDADGTYDLLDGTLVVVREGATYANKIFELHGTYPILPGTSEITAASVADFAMVTAFARTLLDDVDQAAMKTTLGLVIGTNVQAYNANLTTYATTAPTAAGLALLDDANATAQRATLGLVIGTNVQAYDADIPTVTASQAEMEAGAESALRSMSPLNIAQAIDALAPSGAVLGTPVASTSGTSIDFTGLPTGIKRITVTYAGVSGNGTSALLVQLGAGGSVENTGYLGACSFCGATTGGANFTAGFGLNTVGVATGIYHGAITFHIVSTATNTWAAMGNGARSDAAFTTQTAGAKALAGALERIRITYVNGTDAFDAGAVNIQYSS